MKESHKTCWQYSVQLFDRLSLSKKYVVRFRLKYAHLILEKTDLKSKFKDVIQRKLGFFNLYKNLFLYQFIKKPVRWNESAKVIILISNNKTYINCLLPLIHQYLKENRPVILLAPANQLSALKNILDSEVFEKITPFEAVDFGEAFFLKFKRWVSSFFLSCRDIIWFARQSAENAFWFAPALSRFAATHYFFNKSLQDNLKSDMSIFSANDHWMWESLYYTAAKFTDTKTYVLQHGVIGEYTYPLFANKFLAWGKYDALGLQQIYGAKKDEVQIVGSPYFDSVYAKVSSFKKATTQFHQPYILFLGQNFLGSNILEPGMYEQVLEWFSALKDLAASKNKKLVLKLHPWDKRESYENLIKEIEFTTEPLFEVLSKSSVAISMDSTALFESVMFGIPAIQCIPAEQSRQIDLYSSGLCLLTRSAISLNEEVNHLLSNESTYNHRIKEATAALDSYYYHLGNSLKEIDSLLRK